MNSEPIDPNKFGKAEKLDVLLAVFQAQKAESLQHRQQIFNAFAGWSAMLLVAIGAIVALDSPSILDGCAGRWVSGLAIAGLSALVITFMVTQRIGSVEGLNTVRRTERALELFEKGVYVSSESVLPPDWERDARKRPTGPDWCQISVIAVLTVLCLVLIAKGSS